MEALSLTPVAVDNLVTTARLPVSTVQTLLLELDLAGFQPREIEDVIEDDQQRFGRLAGGHGQFPLILAEAGIEQ